MSACTCTVSLCHSTWLHFVTPSSSYFREHKFPATGYKFPFHLVLICCWSLAKIIPFTHAHTDSVLPPHHHSLTRPRSQARPGSGWSRSSVRCMAERPSRSLRSCRWIWGPGACAGLPAGLGAVRWSSEAAGVGPEAGPAPGPAAVAGMEEVEVPGPRSRPRRSFGSGCEAEAVAAEAGGRKEGEGRGRSLLAPLLTGCPAGAVGARRRAGSGPGEEAVKVMEKWKVGVSCSKQEWRAIVWVVGAKWKEGRKIKAEGWRGEWGREWAQGGDGFERQAVWVKRLGYPSIGKGLMLWILYYMQVLKGAIYL